MSDDDIFEEASENNDDDVQTEIRLDEPGIVSRSSPPRTSVSEILSYPKMEKKLTKSGQFIEISIDYPEKLGSGMASYFVYKVTTKTNKPSFLRQDMSVRRRFSDFLGLHSRLQGKYLSAGVIIPPAPEKDVFHNAKLKLSKEDQSNSEFLGRRRAALQRYLQRIARHAMLVIDSDFREFLEDDKELPKAVNTHMVSGANIKKMFKNVGDAMGNISKKVEDCDQWFDDKQVEMDNLDRHLNQIHSSFEQLVIQRRELAQQTKVFSQFCSQLSHVEEHSGLARALGNLSSTENEIGTIEEKQADVEFFTWLELLKDYAGLIGSVKDVLSERTRLYRLWQEEDTGLNKKKEQKIRCELSNKADKIAALEQEIKETENRVQRTKEEFDKISLTIKKEMDTFNIGKIEDFKEGIVKVVQSMIASQENIIELWEKFGPETVGISS